MFQTPVTNLEKIRKARKRVKQLLLQIGLEACKDNFEEINTYNPGDTHNSSTSWEDVSLWEAFGRRNGYRSKQFCCSLCNFSTRLLSSFKSHLQRYHEDEKDQELMSACPSCPYTSQTKNVVKHMRIFHSSVRKVPSEKESPNTVKSVKFSCSKCNFTDNLYYTLKRHVLLTHHQAELENYFGEKSENDLKLSSVFKISPDRFYCKKCSCITGNRDALMYHILTSDKHRDLELKLRNDISDISRPRVRKPYKKFPSSTVAYPPKPPVLLHNATPVAHPATQDVKVLSLPQNGPNTPLLGTPNPPIQKMLPVATVSDPAAGLGQKRSTTLAPSAQVGFVTAQLPQNQSITLQASLPQSVFLAPRFPLNQPVTATVLPSGGQVITGTQAGVSSGVLPINQTLTLNQSAVLTCPQGLQSAVINMSPGVRPNNVAGNQPGIAPNTILTAPILRQLIPTGKQVNGIPTYTLAPLSVTLPVSPCALPAVTPPKVPVQLSQPDKGIQVSTSPASAPSPPAVKAQTVPPKPPKPTAAKSPVIAQSRDKEAKQWKTCPVCNELFPPNVYEVHMQIAHIKQKNSPNKPTASSTNKEAKETVVIAAQAPFLKVLNERSIRCVTCKTFTEEAEVLKHLLMHGMVCLYCKAVFYELRNFIYHMKILHVDKKKLHRDFVKKGVTISSDANGDPRFPHFDFTFTVSREEIGDTEMRIAIVTGANLNTATPIYIKVQYIPESCGSENQQASNCPFCNCALSRSEVYENHLKEKHHIMPTVHTILKTPAFKCIHCCGVYTGSMTLSAISIHLQRCRNAPKDSTSGAELVPENNGKHVKKQNDSGDAQGVSSESKHNYKSGSSASRDLVPSKRRRLDAKPDSLESFETLPSLDILEMIPDSSATVSHESKKEFLSEYFHKKPYPSKKEIELLSALLEMWKSDVASFFGTKRYICLKFLRGHKQRVLLGFKMADLKKVQHDIELSEDY
ncbi:activity-dependent neuroprotector homeobox protein 2 isoform X2 [Hyla sarda]|nr:activity-dependent neuroprotector homeobox protein 2 isoform X2 [Hyla sarda]XP_056377309.1 activity-dependent neuroprotector homeobox protein 2 isoform X2 [Hyla sarda]XP_056377310.1 activity-dependent neuroprotector homeobox protein 2 isoform X2 [Hyla sarda]XP_056377311.1 activity-dependent neuroprotector homeobox protein 2 isoform X2 [Hyla sarda]